MNPETQATIADGVLHRNTLAGRADRRVRLTVAVPFYRFDATQLASELIEQASRIDEGVEIIFADDGSNDPDLNGRISRLLLQSPVACTLLSFNKNLGRAVVRNRLIAQARGDYLLFMDCDMLPDSPGYLMRYMSLVTSNQVDVACGGRSYLRVDKVDPSERLYVAFSKRTECLPAEQRQRRPLWYLLTNNLMIKREILVLHPFDGRFTGWGYEDAQWALSLPASTRVSHLDNTASHMGLLSEINLLEKYDSSIENFLLINERNPVQFGQFAIFKISFLFSRLPMPMELLRRAFRWLILSRWLPLFVRYYSVHGYRACIYAHGLRRQRSIV